MLGSHHRRDHDAALVDALPGALGFPDDAHNEQHHAADEEKQRMNTLHLADVFNDCTDRVNVRFRPIADIGRSCFTRC